MSADLHTLSWRLSCWIFFLRCLWPGQHAFNPAHPRFAEVRRAACHAATKSQWMNSPTTWMPPSDEAHLGVCQNKLRFCNMYPLPLNLQNVHACPAMHGTRVVRAQAALELSHKINLRGGWVRATLARPVSLSLCLYFSHGSFKKLSSCKKQTKHWHKETLGCLVVSCLKRCCHTDVVVQLGWKIWIWIGYLCCLLQCSCMMPLHPLSQEPWLPNSRRNTSIIVSITGWQAWSISNSESQTIAAIVVITAAPQLVPLGALWAKNLQPLIGTSALLLESSPIYLHIYMYIYIYIYNIYLYIYIYIYLHGDFLGIGLNGFAAAVFVNWFAFAVGKRCEKWLPYARAHKQDFNKLFNFEWRWGIWYAYTKLVEWTNAEYVEKQSGSKKYSLKYREDSWNIVRQIRVGSAQFYSDPTPTLPNPIPMLFAIQNQFQIFCQAAQTPISIYWQHEFVLVSYYSAPASDPIKLLKVWLVVSSRRAKHWANHSDRIARLLLHGHPLLFYCLLEFQQTKKNQKNTTARISGFSQTFLTVLHHSRRPCNRHIYF